MSQDGYLVGDCDIYLEKLRILKNQIQTYCRHLNFIQLRSKVGRHLRQLWQEHHGTFGRIRWIIKQPGGDREFCDRYHIIVEYPCRNTGSHLISCWMTEVPITGGSAVGG